MRNITVYPITAEEVREVVGRARDAVGNDTQMGDNDTQMGGVDGLALGYLINFLEDERIQLELRRFLEKAQPRLVVQNLDTLDDDTLRKLRNSAYGVADRDRYLFDVKFRGISDRGSYVYDSSRERIYVRIVDGELRGEINEDNFAIKEPCPAPLVIKEDVEAPVSGLGRLWQDWKNRKWE